MARLVPAVTRALDILEIFLGGADSVSAPEIGRALELPRTTVHELIATLVDRRYLVADGAGRYRLGVRLHQLGSRYAEQLDLIREGRSAAQRVSDQCQETVHLGILEGRDVVYIAKVDSTHAVRMVSAVGLRLPAHCTAVGKMLLAGLAEPALNDLLSGGQALQAMTPSTLTDPAALRADLDDTRRRGAAFEQCESNPDVACVAAPVRDHTGQVVAAMSISVPLIRWTPQRRDELRKLVVAGAEDLSEHLGYRA